ncbi:Trk system potassium transporter TrkA [Kangiella sediminilitoris]|uniref:Trk system potassium uptake protein TrkA n=1 Tax=Kangiella sediminilitoris TaxID=1144748 RepID=A0A1B3BE15_9GAMM|nr:Trk system potassium transporter TrkA [Kangiella sediminilitoris]AOE51013.1 TrkA-N domain protein [Kangiella sediminilitoris]
MKIIILGAGQVGTSLALSLEGENNDITLIDSDPKRLRYIQDHLDLRTIVGHAAFPDVLENAGIDDSDMLVAVTSSDEVNMIACQIAHTLYQTPSKIARIRASNYLNNDNLFAHQHIPVDVVISPERLVTEYIERLVDNPGAFQVLDFAKGLLRLVAVKAYYGGPLVGNALSELKQHLPNVDTRVAAIFRRGRPIVPTGHTVIEADDEVFFLSAKKHIRSVMSELQRLEKKYQRVIIAGGGNIGEGLAKKLEKKMLVKIIERDPHRAEELANNLEDTLVLQGDVSDEDLLNDENISEFDLFIAVTNDDEANIMSALLAKRLGVRKTMVLINRTAYVDLIQGHEIDIAISPQQVTIGSLLTHIRRGHVSSVYSLRRGAAEAIEAIAKGNEQTSSVIGRTISELALPPGTSIGAIVRDEQVIIAHDNVIIRENDHVVLFMVDKGYIQDVERLFQVNVTYF